MSNQFYRQPINGVTPQDLKNINDNFEKLFLYLTNSIRGIDFNQYVLPGGDVSFSDVDCSTLVANTIGATTIKKNNVNVSVEGHSHAAADLTDFLNKTYPVGSVHINTTGTNPGTQFGGTWAAFGTGKTLVGVDTGQTEFNTVEKTGGAKTHTLTVDEMPAHNHNILVDVTLGGSYAAVDITSGTAYTSTDANAVQSKGGGQAHNNLPPYITVYFWKRTA